VVACELLVHVLCEQGALPHVALTDD
jgi:hypothetical protein